MEKIPPVYLHTPFIVTRALRSNPVTQGCVTKTQDSTIGEVGSDNILHDPCCNKQLSIWSSAQQARGLPPARGPEACTGAYDALGR